MEPLASTVLRNALAVVAVTTWAESVWTSLRDVNATPTPTPNRRQRNGAKLTENVGSSVEKLTCEEYESRSAPAAPPSRSWAQEMGLVMEKPSLQ